MTLEDTALVRDAQAGDVAALGMLLERHRALLTANAVRILGHDPATQDVVQDAMLVALARIGELRDATALRSWLVAIVSNAARAELRHRMAEARAGERLAPAVPALDGVDALIERNALRDWVWTALGRLSEPLRTAIVFRYFTEAGSYQAISDACGVPVGTVRSRLAAARDRLADELRATAALAHPAPERLPLALGTVDAMSAFERTGDRARLLPWFAPDVRYVLGDGIERHGLDAYASALAGSFEMGLRSRITRMTWGADLAVTELAFDQPADLEVPCPPAMTQITVHDGHVNRAVLTHFAAPDSAS
jgi:RNA polymerase sigma-70 factor, ECF subfamily